MIRRYKVEGHSMEPSYREGEHLLVRTKFFKPRKGDVVVFSDGKRDLLKRVKSIKNDLYVVTGDNSCHSSTWYVPRDKIKGKLWVTY